MHRERIRKRVAERVRLEGGFFTIRSGTGKVNTNRQEGFREVYGWEVRETITQDIDKRTKQFTLIRQGVLVDILYLHTMYNNL